MKRYFENHSHQKNFRLILIFPLSRDLPLEGRIFPVIPVKTVLPIPKLVRGLKKLLQGLIFRRSRDLPLEREKVFSDTPKNAHLNLLASEGVPQKHPIPSPEKEVMHQQITE